MPIFNYVAKDSDGTYHRGEVEGTDERQAVSLLRRKKLIIVSLKPKRNSSLEFVDKFVNKVPFSEVVVVTRQLATMIEAGLVLSEALDILSEQQTNKTFKRILKDISSDVKGGLDFATALEKHPEAFPKIYCELVKAGQASGKLDVILIDLAQSLEKEREFKGKVKGAMIYPVMVLLLMGGVMLIMVFFVMPRMMGMYKESGLELPLPTKIMLGFTDFMLAFWWLLLIAFVVTVVVFQRFISTPAGRIAFDNMMLKLPIVGRIANLVALTNFTRTFSLLTSSGVSILDSIKIVSTVTGNKQYETGLEAAYKGVERGLSFSNQLLNIAVFPKLVGQMMKTGEATGKLDEVTKRLAIFFETETDQALKNVTALIEPIIMIVLGIGVAFLVIAVILPIYELTTSIK